MYKISTLSVVVVCVVCRGVGASPEDETILNDLRSRLVSAPRLTSFRGAYTLEQHDGAGQRVFLKRHEYRLRGADSYLRIEEPAGNLWLPLTFAYINGSYAIRVESSCSISGELDIGFSQVPWGAYLTPQELLGEIHGKSLAEILLDGESTLLTRDGHTVLSHRYGKGRAVGADIYFDEHGLVTKIEQCMRPPFSDEEVRDRKSVV
jgi:hypothetical protein